MSHGGGCAACGVQVPAALQCQSTWSAARGGVGALGGLVSPPCGTRHSRSTCRGSGHSPLLRTLPKHSRGLCPGVHGSPQAGASPWALPTHRPDGPALAGGISPGPLRCRDRTEEGVQTKGCLTAHTQSGLHKWPVGPSSQGLGTHLACLLAAQAYVQRHLQKATKQPLAVTAEFWGPPAQYQATVSRVEQ